ncbi:MAG: AraC family transcriptional regulator [Spirochaetales bacterium]|nr:AraC family transcriptional regulator [Spirochaetales bacterium]
MLYHCAYGKRNYFHKPVRIFRRAYWEFQVFLGTDGCPVFSPLPECPSAGRGDNFFIIGPGCSHGWKDQVDRDCEIGVFHFKDIPFSLKSVVDRNSWVSCRLDESLVKEIISQAREIVPEVKSPLTHSLVNFQYCQIWLTKIFLDKREQNRPLASREEHIVDAATAWYSMHMDEAVGVNECGRDMGYSASHLRRLFVRIKGHSPAHEFLIMRMNRAAELLTEGSSILETALACGYESHSSFTRAFGSWYGSSPRLWLEKTRVL